MAIQHEMDCLLILPDALLVTILSLLPTKIAARTSVLCHRFRDLWKACTSVDLSFRHGTILYEKKRPPRTIPPSNVAMANSALLSRQPSDQTLLSLRLDIDLRFPEREWKSISDLELLPSDLTPSFLSSLFAHSHSLSLRHLTLDNSWNFENFEIVLHSVFLISSLESLSIRIYSKVPFLSVTTLTRLKKLSINLVPDTSAQVGRLLLELCCLENLELFLESTLVGVVSLSSLTVKTLVLEIRGPFEAYSVRLSMSKLEYLYLRSPENFNGVPHFHGDFPLLRKSVITLGKLYPRDVSAVAQVLNCISHVEELKLKLKEFERIDYPFGTLLEPGKQAPAFPNLKHLYACMCFHEQNLEAMISFLRQSPALQSVKLVHKVPGDFSGQKRRNRNAWRSKLPRNTDGNYQHAYFSNLHLRENYEEFLKLLNRKFAPKKLQAHN